MRIPLVARAFLASAALLPGITKGGDLLVPADHPTIQGAIVAAVDGDSILVDPGTYVESIDFLGKSITVSAVAPDPALTVIAAPTAAPAASFRSGEPLAALLAGFTLAGGSGVEVGADFVGGNLFVDGASPTLRRLVVRENSPVRAGGGAWFRRSNARLEDVRFFQCSADDGGGIHAIESSLVLDGTRFEACSATTLGGGLQLIECPSIALVESSIVGNRASDSAGLHARDTVLEVTGCHFQANLADEGSGGGMGLEECRGLVARCSFVGNIAALGYGGGVHIGGDAPISVVDCDFRANAAAPFGFGSHLGVENLGGAVGPTIADCRCSDAPSCVYATGAALFERVDCSGVTTGFGAFGVAVFEPGAARFVDVSIRGFDAGVLFHSTQGAALERCRVTDSFYAGIEAYEGSGVVQDCQITGSWIGVYCENAPFLLDGCTISDNFNPGSFPGGVAAFGSSAPTLRNSIVHGNGPIEIEDVTSDGIVVEHSDVGGGWPGPGNLDADPRFRDPAGGDFRLGESSPCIDAADPALRTARRELSGRPRSLDGRLVRAERVDMGAFESGPLTLHVAGDAAPGGTVTIGASGNTHLLVWLLAGLDGATLDHPFLGTFYVDLSTAPPLVPWAPPPSSTAAKLPYDLPVPLTIHLQLVGLRVADGAGGTSNDVILQVE